MIIPNIWLKFTFILYIKNGIINNPPSGNEEAQMILAP